MERIIIDTDLGIDDAVGITLAVGSSALEVEGITLVSSTGEIEETILRAGKVLKACGGEHIKIYRGANYPLEKDHEKVKTFKEKYLHRFNQLEEATQNVEHEVGVDYLIRKVLENPGEITIVTMGALTNVAIALQKEPLFAEKVKQLIISGGSQAGGNCTPVAEFNFWADPQAAKRVFEAGIPMTMIGLDTTRQVVLTEACLEKLTKVDSKEAKLVKTLMGEYQVQSENEIKTSKGMIDAVVPIAYLMNPETLETEESHVCIEVKGKAKGQSIVDQHGVWNQGICNCQVAKHVNQKTLQKVVEERFA